MDEPRWGWSPENSIPVTCLTADDLRELLGSYIGPCDRDVAICKAIAAHLLRERSQ